MQQTTAPGRRGAGFTMVELVVVVVILTFLAFAASSLLTVVGASIDREAAAAELSLVALLLRLAGLAVLLFGAGSWYLVELRQPGRLDSFRLGHFLLLALTYSLFFVVFAVLGAREVDAWLAVGIAAVVSYPLLVLHVATIVDRRFAIASALPLAAVTTAVVVNGVYGGEVRSYVWLGLLCAVIAFLTLTYPTLGRGLEARRRELADRLALASAELAPPAHDLLAAIAEARARLALHDPVELTALRTWVERRVKGATGVLDEHEQFTTLHQTAQSATTRRERLTACATGLQLAARLATLLPQTRAALVEATSALANTRTGPDAGAAPRHHGTHCLACGQGTADGARFCAACGTRCAETRPCRRCREVLRVPVHLLAAGTGKALPATHCASCGEPHADTPPVSASA
ncbi:MAG: zinc ribbon domain-containing protein [Planctomycetota bacterium]